MATHPWNLRYCLLVGHSAAASWTAVATKRHCSTDQYKGRDSQRDAQRNEAVA